MKPDQKEIYYLLGEETRSLLHSPHLESFQAQGLEVLLLTEPVDSFMLMGLHKYKDFELKNAAQAVLPEKPKSEEQEQEIPETDFKSLVERFKQVLGDRVRDVCASERLLQSVARLVDPEGSLPPEYQRVNQFLGRQVELPKKILELNPSHVLLKNLLKLEAGSELSKLVIEQIYDSALLVEGLHPDPSSMVPRLQQIMAAALEREGKK
jgi:HSP90 family molecular chaperone